MNVGFVVCELLDGRFVPWEASLDWESYIDLYCLALGRRGHTCVKYVPSTGVDKTNKYHHRFGHIVKRVPVFNKVFNARWLNRPRTYAGGLTTAAHQMLPLGFSANLVHEIKEDRLDILHYSSYYSTFFVPSLLLRLLVPVVAQYSGGALPGTLSTKTIWRLSLIPPLKATASILVGGYETERYSLTKELGVRNEKIKSFDAPIVDDSVFQETSKRKAQIEIGFPEDTLNILSVTFIPRRHSIFLAKNPFLLLALFASAIGKTGHRMMLHFAGFGPGMEDLIRYTNDLGISHLVRLYGMVDHRRLPFFYSASDIVFVPYAFERLNEGSATFEAFACGRPVAGFKRHSTVSTEQPGGFLVDLSSADCVDTFIDRITNPEYLKMKGNEGYTLSRRVTLGASALALERAYQEAIRRRNDRLPNFGELE